MVSDRDPSESSKYVIRYVSLDVMFFIYKNLKLIDGNIFDIQLLYLTKQNQTKMQKKKCQKP